MRPMADFKRLEVWQKAHALTMRIHTLATTMRRRDHASLRSQMIRAAQSIAANIVEGRGQASDAEFIRYLRQALNSASELEYHLICARDLKAISPSGLPSPHR